MAKLDNRPYKPNSASYELWGELLGDIFHRFPASHPTRINRGREIHNALRKGNAAIEKMILTVRIQEQFK